MRASSVINSTSLLNDSRRSDTTVISPNIRIGSRRPSHITTNRVDPTKDKIVYIESTVQSCNTRTCSQHSKGICGDRLEFADPSQYYKRYIRPTNMVQVGEDVYENRNMPTPRKFGNSKVVVTEEALDDWFAQSMNRNLMSMLATHKNFHIPPSTVEGFKRRYASVDERAKNRAKASVYYFPQRGFEHRKEGGNGKTRASGLIVKEIHEQLFDSSLLEPRTHPEGPFPADHPMFYVQHPQAASEVLAESSTKSKKFQKVMSKIAISNILGMSGIVKRSQEGEEDKFSLAQLTLGIRAKEKNGSAGPELIRAGNRIQEMLAKRNKELVYHQKAAHLLREDVDIDREKLANDEEEMLAKITAILSLSAEQSYELSELLKDREIKQYNQPLATQIKILKNNVSYEITRAANMAKQELSKQQMKSAIKSIWEGKPGTAGQMTTGRTTTGPDVRSMNASPVKSAQKDGKVNLNRSFRAAKFQSSAKAEPKPISQKRGLSETLGSRSKRSDDLLRLELGATGTGTGVQFDSTFKKRLVNQFYSANREKLLERVRSDDEESVLSINQDKVDKQMQSEEDGQFDLAIEARVRNALDEGGPKYLTQTPVNKTEESSSTFQPNDLTKIRLHTGDLLNETTQSSIINANTKAKSIRKDSPHKVQTSQVTFYTGNHHTSSSKPANNNNTEFWFTRGSLQMKKGNLRNAIDCFKQVLMLDPHYYLCSFNIGCMYENLGSYDSAKKWLKLCYDIKFCLQEVLYALALCEFKTSCFARCFDYLAELDRILIQEAHPEPNYKILYLNALCCKELGKRDDMKKLYQTLQNKLAANYRTTITKIVMGYALLKIKGMKLTIPREATHELNVYSIILSEENHPIKPILHPLYVPNDGWKSDYVAQVIAELRQRRFWKRFPPEFLQSFLRFLTPEVIPAGSVIHPHTTYTMTIIQGSVIVRDHSVDYLNPRTIGFLKEGSILGYDEITQFIHKRSEVWLYCLTDIEVLKAKKSDFEKIWQAQKEFQRNLTLNFITDLDIFKGLSQQTLNQLAYEMLRRDKFSKDEVIFNDNSYITSEHVTEIQTKFKSSFPYQFKKDHTIESLHKGRKLFHETEDKLKKMERVPKSRCLGFYIILSGDCVVENCGGFVFSDLSRGSFFGETLMVATKGYNSFGQIRVVSEKVEVMFLPKTDFGLLSYHELEIMKNNCNKRQAIKKVQLLSDIRYKTELKS